MHICQKAQNFVLISSNRPNVQSLLASVTNVYELLTNSSSYFCMGNIKYSIGTTTVYTKFYVQALPFSVDIIKI